MAGEDIVSGVVDKVKQEGEGLISRLVGGVFSLPLDAAGGIWNTISGMGKGLLNFGGILKTGFYTAVAWFLGAFAVPELRQSLLRKIGGNALLNEKNAALANGNIMGLIEESALVGLTGGALWNVAGSAVDGALGSTGIGGKLAGGATLATVGLLAYNHASVADGTPATTPTPLAIPVKDKPAAKTH
jgi:hypothetical protein